MGGVAHCRRGERVRWVGRGGEEIGIDRVWFVCGGWRGEDVGWCR